MRITKTSVLFIFLMMLIATLTSYAQIPDTLIVAANPPGNLNNLINGDTTATGERVNPKRIYVLKQTGTIDTIYFLTEEIRIKNLTLVGMNNPNTSYPPVIAPRINDDGSSVESFIKAEKGAIIKLKNLYLLATRTDGSSVTNSAISADGDNVRFLIDGCVFENFGSRGTPNIINTWNAIGSDIFVTNCLFRNNQSDVPQNPGMNWAGPGVNAVDTMIVKNSTFFVFGGNIEGSGSSIGYLEFDHNTIFMQTKSSPFHIRQMHNAKITNNIFFSVFSAGLDSLHSFNSPVLSSNFFVKPAVIILDSLYSDLEGDPYFLTETDRNIVAINNAYFWPQAIVDNFDTMNADEKYQVVGGKILAPAWVATRIGAESLLDLPNIQVAEENNYNIDPGFASGLVLETSDSMARFVRYVWENGGSGAGSRPFVYLSDPNNMFAGIAENWAEIQGYPVRENLRYTNHSLMTAGTDALPLGDLNWFPEKMPITEVAENTNAQPVEFSLSQNYPNPFNPTTTIKYQVPSVEKGHTSSLHTTLIVYNSLGQQVFILVNEQKSPGDYEVKFDAGSLASGVYLYRLQAGSFSTAKKMVLLR